MQITKPSASLIAQRTGATLFEETIEEDGHLTRHKNKRDVDKSLSEDEDYEVYQGVVGRPGIDFPVLTRIPQTSFNCRKIGNGYFADLETDCQVTGLMF